MSGTVSRRRALSIGLAVLALALAVSGARLVGWLGGDDPDALVVTADFTDTTGVYVGNDVTYLGVQVGEIVDVEPHGPTMRVVMQLEPGTRVPAEAAAEILQGSLVTDRFIELGPVWDGGPTLAHGGHIDADHTRSPATVDQIAASIDDLVLAMDANLGTGPDATSGGKTLGQVLATMAETLDGNGTHLRAALSESRDALATVNAKDADLTALTANLLSLVDTLGERDTAIRDFTTAAATTTGILAERRDELVAALDSLDELTGLADAFLKENGKVLSADLAGLAEVVGIVAKNQASLEEAFDVMPTMAENFNRAYDWDLGRLRVQFAFAVGPFSALFRDHTCKVFAETLAGGLGTQLCGALFSRDGTGALDGLLDGIYDALPGGIP